jgi:hypothetical protein
VDARSSDCLVVNTGPSAPAVTWSWLLVVTEDLVGDPDFLRPTLYDAVVGAVERFVT